MDKETIEKLIFDLSNNFEIKKKVAYRATILKMMDENKDNTINEHIAAIILITTKFKEEESGNQL